MLNYDDGRDFCQIEFSSDYKAGSKANLEDARKELRKRGKQARNYEITSIELIK